MEGWYKEAKCKPMPTVSHADSSDCIATRERIGMGEGLAKLKRWMPTPAR